jgi:hypothetical protein
MHKICYAFFLVVFLTAASGLSAGTNDSVKALMTNKWIAKYKQLKKDIENKAATVKDMEDISENDYNLLRDSYDETSLRLEIWLQNLEATLEKGDAADADYFVNGRLSPSLEKELREIATFYANDFSTLYEEVTGIKTRSIINLNDDEEIVNSGQPASISWKFMHEELSASLQPLRPLDWNSVY